jgi:dTDP-4-dehydrorhamnose reductase
MNVLVTGGKGQLGRALVRRGAHGVDIDELDICDAAAVAARIAGYDVVINAAAYTAVDKAESEPERAFAVNATGAGNVAAACRDRAIRCVHVSTDYVFAGTASQPYREDDPICPIGVYGESKARGEALVRDAGGTIVRTSWLFGAGGPSFVHTIVRVAKERPVLRVVADQHGCPTWTDDLADALLVLARAPVDTYHFCNSEPTTWHGFATAVVELARRYTPIACERIDAITTAEYPLPARRPAYSVLGTSRLSAFGIAPRTWRVGLAEMLAGELGPGVFVEGKL